MLGFAVAIWQILKVKRAADAARRAALGLVRRVRSRELLAKLGDAHAHLELARNDVGRGERRMAVMRLGSSSACTIEAREISQAFRERSAGLDALVIALGDLTEQLMAMSDPLMDDPFFTPLQLQLRQASERLLQIRAQSRYEYDLTEESNG